MRAPAAELRDKDGVDLAGLGECHHLVALRTVILGAGGCLPEDRDNLVVGALGEGTQVTLLAFTGLVVGADPAVDRNLSQLNPPAIGPFEARKYVAFNSEMYQID